MSNLPCLIGRSRHCVFSDLESTDCRRVLLEVKHLPWLVTMIYIQKLGVRKHAMVFNCSTQWDVLAAVEMNSDYLCQLEFVC